MKKYRASAGYLLLAAALGVFVWYGLTHKQLWTTLGNLNAGIVILLISLYFVMLGVLVGQLRFIVELCGKKINLKDNLRISSYSQIVNFFGPLQSGPAVRAVYLKRNYKVPIRNFVAATVIYYLFYAAVSGIAAIAPSAYWRWLILLVPLGVFLCWLFYKIYIKFIYKEKPGAESGRKLGFKPLAYLLLVTIFQVVLQAIIYYVELKTANRAISLRQTFIYTGVANFALFVALTPGAIGIREAFLLFSTKLHHISPKSIVAASFIDRAVFITFLGILFVITVSLHFKDKLKIKKADLNLSSPEETVKNT